MLIERWHKRLKYELVNIKRTIRGDSLVDILIGAPATMEEDRVIKMARGLNYGRHRLLRHHRAHALAVKLYGNKPEAVEVLREGWWRLTDSKGIHHIRQYTCICDEKPNNHCKRCNACAYEELPICNEVEVVTPNTSDPCGSLDIGKENAYCVVEKSLESSILDKNKKILNELEAYIADIRSHFIQLSKVPDDEATERLKNPAASMHSMRVDASTAIEQLRVKRKEGLVVRSELPAVGGLPNHTPIRLQERSALKSKNRPESRQEEDLNECDLDKLECCIMCYRRIPDTNADVDDWVKCSFCGMWAHEACAEEGSFRPYDEGKFEYAEVAS